MTNIPISTKTCPETQHSMRPKQLKAQMRHMWPHMHCSSSEMSRQNKSGGSHAAHCRWTKRTLKRVNAGGAVKLDTLVTCMSLCGCSGKLSGVMPCISGSKSSHSRKAKCWFSDECVKPYSVPFCICMQATTK